METEDSKAYTVIITVLYAAAIGVNVYLIWNDLTDGALSTAVSMHYTHLRGKVKTVAKHRRDFQRAKGQMLWEAIQTVEGAQ